MDKDELVKRIKGEVEFCCAGGSPGNISRSQYRSGLFSVFVDAYRSGFLEGPLSMTGDLLHDKLLELWAKENKTSPALSQAVGDFARMWMDWRYAWDRIDEHPEAGARTG